MAIDRLRHTGVMTRIVAGVAGGRRLRVPPSGTRPTSERVREALFSMLAHRLGSWPEQVVLDAFAGSGALGLEAASRGASAVLLLDKHPSAVAVLQANADGLGIAGVTVERADAWRLSTRPRPQKMPGPVTLLFADPPYTEPGEQISTWLIGMAESDWLAPSCVAVVERAARGAEFRWPPGWQTLTDRRYSDTVVHVGRRSEILFADQREEST